VAGYARAANGVLVASQLSCTCEAAAMAAAAAQQAATHLLAGRPAGDDVDVAGPGDAAASVCGGHEGGQLRASALQQVVQQHPAAPLVGVAA
jgi:hypothetical protein